MLNNLKEVILASNNKNKLLELEAILAPIKCISQQDCNIHEVEETGLTFIENAIIKARHASKISNKPALADDSGLVVEALDGRPGIYSARFAGINATDEDNINLLLKEMINIPFTQRKAYFYTVIVLIEHELDPTPIIATGKLSGFISIKAKGTHGFGYDPVFYLPEYDCNVAELTADIKNKISHRAQALTKLREQLKKK